jgi:hypothetical protein
MATAELDFDHNLFAAQGRQGPAPGDEKLFVKFYMHFIEDPVETEKEGRPVFKDTEFIRILTPGDRNNIVDRPVRPDDKIRFSNQYNHYKQFGTQAVIGTVLEEWPLITKAMVENLKQLGFHTVEQLGEARDDVVLNNPGLMTLRTRAQNYLAVAKSNAPLTQLESAIAEKDNELDVLRRQVKELAATVKELTDAKAKK